MFKQIYWHGLSGKLLLLTVVFVMLAETLIFIPSAAQFRHSWLTERAEAAGLITLAIGGVPNYEGSAMLSKRFMRDTDVSMVTQKRGGISQIVLGAPPKSKIVSVDDLRTQRLLPSFRKTFQDFFGDDSGYIRVIAEPTVDGVESLEFLVPRAALKMALNDYCANVLIWSFVISLITGILIYLVLTRTIVTPLQRLGQGLATFRADPRKRSYIPVNPSRKDEIGVLEREFIDMKDDVRLTLTQQERLATLGMAMAKINHDLRNVLTSTQLISDRLAADKDTRIARMGKRLVKAVDRGVHLCEATLKFSQSVEEHPNFKSFRISALVDEAAADSMIDTSEILFFNSIPRRETVYADSNQTYRILHNLFRNAVQAMAKSECKEIHISASRLEDKILIRIRDTGPGLPKIALDNLFKAFTSSTQKDGTGLGLTIARELARAQNGNLLLKYTDETGTVFTVSLPSAPTKKYQAKTPV